MRDSRIVARGPQRNQTPFGALVRGVSVLGDAPRNRFFLSRTRRSDRSPVRQGRFGRCLGLLADGGASDHRADPNGHSPARTAPAYDPPREPPPSHISEPVRYLCTPTHLYPAPQHIDLGWGVGAGLSNVSRSIRPWLCRPLQMKFGEFTFHAIGCIKRRACSMGDIVFVGAPALG